MQAYANVRNYLDICLASILMLVATAPICRGLSPSWILKSSPKSYLHRLLYRCTNYKLLKFQIAAALFTTIPQPWEFINDWQSTPVSPSWASPSCQIFHSLQCRHCCQAICGWMLATKICHKLQGPTFQGNNTQSSAFLGDGRIWSKSKIQWSFL
jgi:hypothetical protein